MVAARRRRGPDAPTAEATARRRRCQAPRLESARRLGV